VCNSFRITATTATIFGFPRSTRRLLILHPQMRRSLARRFRYLRNWEAFNAVAIPLALPALARFQFGIEQGWGLILGAAALLGFLLAQGALYWHLKLRQVGGHWLPLWFSPVFEALRLIDRMLLVAFPMGVAWAVADSAGAGAVGWTTIAYVVAAGEYLNYYVVQLIHDTPNDLTYWRRYRRLRRSPLRKDLAASRRGAPA
jgi:hypothetical protein